MSGSIPPIARNAFMANLRIKCASVIAASRWWLVGHPEESAMMLYDTQSRLMWDYNCETWYDCTLLEAQEHVEKRTGSCALLHGACPCVPSWQRSPLATATPSRRLFKAAEANRLLDGAGGHARCSMR